MCLDLFLKVVKNQQMFSQFAPAHVPPNRLVAKQTLIAWLQARLIGRPTYTVKSKRKMSGLQSRNSTNFFITRNKNKPCSVSKSASVWLDKNLTSKFKPKSRDASNGRMNSKCMTSFSKNMSNYLASVKWKRPMHTSRKSSLRRRVVTDN